MSVPASSRPEIPASSSASQVGSRRSLCCGSIAAASRGETPKKSGSKRSTDSRKAPRRTFFRSSGPTAVLRGSNGPPPFRDVGDSALPVAQEPPERVHVWRPREPGRHPDDRDRLVRRVRSRRVPSRTVTGPCLLQRGFPAPARCSARLAMVGIPTPGSETAVAPEKPTALPPAERRPARSSPSPTESLVVIKGVARQSPASMRGDPPTTKRALPASLGDRFQRAWRPFRMTRGVRGGGAEKGEDLPLPGLSHAAGRGTARRFRV